ncbi:hypothetical protein SDC9_185946 [bioreactor metagenome]|uniref:Uncharacterized protein n=1 Tax=bioreactor metagenome TaxID=1076179 RepID=A0A645HJ38_9ZZZZ
MAITEKESAITGIIEDFIGSEELYNIGSTGIFTPKAISKTKHNTKDGILTPRTAITVDIESQIVLRRSAAKIPNKIPTIVPNITAANPIPKLIGIRGLTRLDTGRFLEIP